MNLAKQKVQTYTYMYDHIYTSEQAYLCMDIHI